MKAYLSGQEDPPGHDNAPRSCGINATPTPRTMYPSMHCISLNNSIVEQDRHRYYKWGVKSTHHCLVVRCTGYCQTLSFFLILFVCLRCGLKIPAGNLGCMFVWLGKSRNLTPHSRQWVLNRFSVDICEIQEVGPPRSDQTFLFSVSLSFSTNFQKFVLKEFFQTFEWKMLKKGIL